MALPGASVWAAGVEEGPVVALQQLLHPTTSRCKLVALDPPPRWHTDWEDPGRLAWHRDKMESKVGGKGGGASGLGKVKTIRRMDVGRGRAENKGSPVHQRTPVLS